MNSEFPNAPSDGPEAGASKPDLLREELAVQRQHNLRLAADFEKFKRRTRQESEARAVEQKGAFIQELLPAIDDLERGLDSGAAADSREFYQGVEMTLLQLQELLRQHGIETEDIVGQPFDPHLHEAVSLGHDPSQPDHVILKVFQRGYRRGSKIFRPAKVMVNDLTNSNPAHHVR